MSVEFKKDLLYRQLKEAILSGKYPPGSRFPCEVDFASQLGVAFVTLRSALKRLEDDGLITRLRSRGTFVNELPSSVPAEKSSRRKILLVIRGENRLENMAAGHTFAAAIGRQELPATNKAPFLCTKELMHWH